VITSCVPPTAHRGSGQTTSLHLRETLRRSPALVIVPLYDSNAAGRIGQFVD